MPQQIAVIGPPGTGKTEAMTTVAKRWFKSGADPEDVAYLAFTKAAAHEAGRRMFDGGVAASDVQKKLPYFRTIHSLAYRSLKKDKPDVRLITTADMKGFVKTTGFEGSYMVQDWEDLAEVYQRLENKGRTEWDKALTAYTLSRISARSADDLERAKREMSRTAWRTVGALKEDLYAVFVRKYERFKEQEGLIDFPDMLEYALTEMRPLPVKKVVIDECQDLSAALFSIAERLFENAEEIWMAGDPDQCVYGFAAAKASLFINRVRRANRRIFLQQTHRFGQEVVDFSEKIITRVRDRISRNVWGLPGRTHEIRYTGDFKPMVAPMLILHRHVLGCQALAEIFIQAGLPFRNERGRDPLSYRLRVTAFETLCELAAGKKVAPGALQRLVEEMIPSTYVNPDTKESLRLIVHGGKKRLQEGLGKEPMSLGELVTRKIFTEKGSDLVRSKSFGVFKYQFDLMYYQRVIDNGYTLDSKSVPRISTLHGAKGREAPMVVLFTEAGKRCWDDEDAEHRLAFVGATRTQGELEICSDRTLDWANAPYPYPEPPAPWGPVPDEDPFA